MEKTLPNIENTDKLYDLWLHAHSGMDKNSFYHFLTTPSRERELFLREHTVNEFSFQNNQLITKANLK